MAEVASSPPTEVKKILTYQTRVYLCTLLLKYFFLPILLNLRVIRNQHQENQLSTELLLLRYSHLASNQIKQQDAANNKINSIPRRVFQVCVYH